MYFCANINWRGVCKLCGCDKNKHEWRTTLTELVTKTVDKGEKSRAKESLTKLVTETVKKGEESRAEESLTELVTETVKKGEESRAEESVIPPTVDSGKVKMIDVDSGDALNTIDMIYDSVSASEQRLEKCKSESEQMLRTCAQLNTFVHQNALMEHGDKLSIRLQDRIEIHEKAKSTAKELGVLIQIQCQYQTFLDEEKNNSYSADDVDELIQQIYKLPMKGKDVKKAMEVEEEARRAVVEMGKKSKPFSLSWLRKQAGKLVSTVSGTKPVSSK